MNYNDLTTDQLLEMLPDETVIKKYGSTYLLYVEIDPDRRGPYLGKSVRECCLGRLQFTSTANNNIIGGDGLVSTKEITD